MKSLTLDGRKKYSTSHQHAARREQEDLWEIVHRLRQWVELLSIPSTKLNATNLEVGVLLHRLRTLLVAKFEFDLDSLSRNMHGEASDESLMVHRWAMCHQMLYQQICEISEQFDQWQYVGLLSKRLLHVRDRLQQALKDLASYEHEFDFTLRPQSIQPESLKPL